MVGGDFTTLAGQTRNRIARLNADGSLDATFDPNASDIVYTLALQPDGKLLLGGKFFTISGQSHRRIARLHADGSLDTAFNPNAVGNDASGIVSALAVLADGKVVLGGIFT